MAASVSADLPRRLPVVPVPLPDESLLSWLDQLSAVYGVNRIIAAQACGVMRLDDRVVRISASSSASAVFGMEDDDVRRVRAATGLTSTKVRQMTWTRFAGSLDSEVSGSSRRAVSVNVGDPGALRFCPSCVEERDGRWPLAWSTPWVFACLKHQCYLLTACPACRRSVRAGEADLARGACRGAVRDTVHGIVRSCSTAYRNMQAPPLRDPLLAGLQRRLDDHLSLAVPNLGAARADLTDLAAMADMALFLATPDHLSDADPVVLERFTVFSRRYSATYGRLMRKKDRDTPELLVRTGCLRIASKVVFSKDPLSTALTLADFKSRPFAPSVRPLHQSWLMRPPGDTTERLAKIVSAVRAPARPTRGDASRIEVGGPVSH